MKKSQEQKIIEILERKHFITRNQCLKMFISRLGSRIYDLKKSGWEINGSRMENGDYVYTVLKFPEIVV